MRTAIDCDRLEVIIIPFPFTDNAPVKGRPSVVLSSHAAGQGAAEIVNRPSGVIATLSFKHDNFDRA